MEAFHEGYNPRTARKASGSWLGFLASTGMLSEDEERAFDAGREFLEQLETTPMTRSYKMLTLLALLRREAIPGSLGLDDLATEVRRVAERSPKLTDDLSVDPSDDQALRQLLVKNPIRALAEGKGTGGKAFFEHDETSLRSRFTIPEPAQDAFRDLVREIVDWRLAEYLQRAPIDTSTERFLCRVSHASGRPILFLPDRDKRDGIPSGWQEVLVNGEPVQMNFVKVAVNVARRAGSETNVLPEILTEWFGPDAGQPGTHHQVAIEATERGLVMEPVQADRPLWKTYARPEIPHLFGLPYEEHRWRQGYVVQPGHMFLLVTLDKSGMDSRYDYRDRFLSPELFQWQSQNRTTQGGIDGKRISDPAGEGSKTFSFSNRCLGR